MQLGSLINLNTVESICMQCYSQNKKYRGEASKLLQMHLQLIYGIIIGTEFFEHATAIV